MKNLLSGYPVVIEIPVAWGEMDMFGHVNNVVYFRYFESARIAYFEKLNLLDAIKEKGIGPILASTSCRFKIPLTYPDKIFVGAKTGNIEADRFTVHHIAVSEKHQKIAAEGNAVVVTFDYRANKKTPLPEALRQKIMSLQP